MIRRGTQDLLRFLDTYCEPLRQFAEKRRQRIVIVMSIFLLCAGTISARLLQIMVVGETPEVTPSSFDPLSSLRFSRADIVDRKGVLIATSLPTVSVYANPRELLNPIADAQLLSKT
ncbi:MAG: hypothetical protein LBQ26_00755, partial [Holosporales bacterium]|nr:hypothetical protein [Holosporales bacterium]